MKRKAVSCLLVLAAIMTMTPTIPTMAAENPDNTTQSTQTTTEAGTQNSVVKYDQASAFTVTIPKSIALSSSKSAEYTVKVQGDVIGNEIITVTPDESVILSDSNGKDPVTGDITQEKTEFSSTEVNARSGGGTATGSILANNLTSGDWSGNFKFVIRTNQIGNGTAITSENLATYGIKTVGDVVIPEYVTDDDNTRHAVTGIGDYAFRDCNEMTSVTIADSVTEIGTGAFVNCSKLSRAAVPNSVRSIGNSAFDGCISLSSISYNGNEYDLSNIEPAFVENGVSVGSHVFEHSYSEPVYTWSENNSTCMATKTCSECHDVVTETADVSTKTTDATCTNEGLNTYTATFKNSDFETQTKTSKISAKGHKSVSANNAVAPTCVTDGKESDTVCSVCGVTLATGKTIAQTGHKYGTPTYTWSKDGKTCIAKRVCTNNTLHIETEEATITHSVKTEATCTSKGTTTYTATFKNTAFVTQTKDIQDIGELGHNPIAGTCTRCKERIAGLYDVDGKLLCSWEDSGINIEKNYGTKSSTIYYKTEITSPYYVLTNNYPTTTKIVIPDNVTNIGEYTFCNYLQPITISIPSSVTSIEKSAFSGCTGLSGIEIDSNSIVNIKKNAFYNCSSLNGIELPNSLVEIGEKAFFGCTSLVYIKIPDNVTKIGAFAFQSCSKLQSIHMFDNVTVIEKYAFSKCPELTNINIPRSLRSIEEGLFWQDSKLTKVIIPNGIENIGMCAFKECRNLTSVSYKGIVYNDDIFLVNALKENNVELSINNSLHSGTDIFTYSGIETATISNGNLEVYGISSSGDVVIPSYVIDIYGTKHKVNRIGFQAFFCKEITSISMPSDIISIGDYAMNNTKLSNITIPDNVVSIGEYAFSSNQITSVTYKGSVYTNRSELLSALIQNGVTIGEHIFTDTNLRD